jgi:hypothetical protein
VAVPGETTAVFPGPAAPWLVGGAGVGSVAGGGAGEVERLRGQAILEAVCFARLGELKSQCRKKVKERKRETRNIE